MRSDSKKPVRLQELNGELQPMPDMFALGRTRAQYFLGTDGQAVLSLLKSMVFRADSRAAERTEEADGVFDGDGRIVHGRPKKDGRRRRPDGPLRRVRLVGRFRSAEVDECLLIPTARVGREDGIGEDRGIRTDRGTFFAERFLKDAVILAEYLYRNHIRPEQVQDFYPTPGTVSTCMFYTGLDPYTLKPVFVEKTPEGKALQRALLQYYEPRNAARVVKALKLTHREDLIPLLVPASARRKESKPWQNEKRPAAPAAKRRSSKRR